MGANRRCRNCDSIGNRDYEAKAQKCLTFGDDGVTLTVDTPQADLLLEAEIGYFAEPLAIEPNGVRKFRLTGSFASPRGPKAVAHSPTSTHGLRNGPGRRCRPPGVCYCTTQLPPPQVAKLLVVKLPTTEIADGVMQLPATRAHYRGAGGGGGGGAAWAYSE